MTDYFKAERDYWAAWWATATPKVREWARSVSGKPITGHELVTDDEGDPAGITSTGGMMPRFAEMFPEEVDAEGGQGG